MDQVLSAVAAAARSRALAQDAPAVVHELDAAGADTRTPSDGPAVEDLAHVFVELVRSSAGVPPRGAAAANGTSLDTLTSLYPDFAADLARCRERIITLFGHVIDLSESGRGETLAARLRREDAAGGVGESACEDAFEVLDGLRETAESFVDEAKGQHASQQVARVQSQLDAAARGKSRAASGHTHTHSRTRGPLRTSARVSAKPQDSFYDAPMDNSRETVFVSRLRHKYHDGVPRLGAVDTHTHTHTHVTLAPHVHPYAQELQALAFPHWQLAAPVPPAGFSPIESAPCEFIATRERLEALVRHLEGSDRAALQGGDYTMASSASLAEPEDFRVPASCASADGAAPVREIALDLEAHSLRSFQGFTCLMQLSTRTHDYLIDALVLREHMSCLNRVFTDPRIVKVLHGCDSDVLWLQRDFGVYLVNVFDTGQASRALAYTSFGLAHLLQEFAHVTANKEYQTADWRERPLPAALLKYAREDTHYLLGIYDRLRAELASRSTSQRTLRCLSWSGHIEEANVPDLLASVLQKSTEKTAVVYEKEVFSPLAYRRLLARLGRLSAAGASEQEAKDTPFTRVFAALYDWRDATARNEDESPFYILSNRHLERLAERRPRTVDILVRELSPLSDALRRHAEAVVAVIRNIELQNEHAMVDSPSAVQREPSSALGKRRAEEEEDEERVVTPPLTYRASTSLSSEPWWDADATRCTSIISRASALSSSAAWPDDNDAGPGAAMRHVLQRLASVHVLDMLAWRTKLVALVTASQLSAASVAAVAAKDAIVVPAAEPAQAEATPASIAQRYPAQKAKKPRLAASSPMPPQPDVTAFDYDGTASRAIRSALSDLAARPLTGAHTAVALPSGQAPAAEQKARKHNPYLTKRHK